jgi:hypothetical protein
VGSNPATPTIFINNFNDRIAANEGGSFFGKRAVSKRALGPKEVSQARAKLARDRLDYRRKWLRGALIEKNAV